MFKADGPEAYRCVGETEFVNGIAAMSASGTGKSRIAADIGTVDLRIGDAAGVLMHIAAGGGRFRGIRRAPSGTPAPTSRTTAPTRPRACCCATTFARASGISAPASSASRSGAPTPRSRTPSVSRAFPDTTIVLDHFGGPIGTGPYAGKQEEVFGYWKGQIDELARCPNVVAKLGGLNMVVNGYGWEHRPLPPTSTELMQATRRYFEHTIDRFGANRCMFESNFPVDKLSCSYTVLELVQTPCQSLLADERATLFYGTAARVYRL
jgi:predicted TIM-barrel fold metal-dependent hydrolase